ncbi:uncharacterized protein LOC117178844 [Belonocnema kinseyi]|uniref:uncharacterized protein LOC117178844 n=1 Tax=Belonocnema kinseyi TaxID=2817044 RepID=UPI00143DDD0C|nr:uncharacterized protein LOC117178844 [Belonocnema kinseyi]
MRAAAGMFAETIGYATITTVDNSHFGGQVCVTSSEPRWMLALITPPFTPKYFIYIELWNSNNFKSEALENRNFDLDPNFKSKPIRAEVNYGASPNLKTYRTMEDLKKYEPKNPPAKGRLADLYRTGVGRIFVARMNSQEVYWGNLQ